MVVLNREEVRRFLKSTDVETMCREAAERITSRNSDGSEVTTYIAGTRVVVSIAGATQESVKDNFENNILLKAVGR